MSQVAPASASFGIGRKTIVLLTSLVGVYFISEFVFRYFNWSPEAYGPYYWEHRVALLLHVLGGSVALVTGGLQLWTGLGRRAMRVHPINGRIYMLAIAVGASASFYLSINSTVFGLTFAVGLFCLGLAWVATTAMAFVCIRRRNQRLHKQWMIRSYIVTFGFVSFRICTDYLPYGEWWGLTRPEISNAVVWAVWVLPMLTYEIIAQYRELR